MTLGSGQSASCSITNTSQPATLTLVKNVDNSNGGTATASNWTLSATGPSPISGASASPAVTGAAVKAGTYTLAESTGPADYTAGGGRCAGGTLSGSSPTPAAGQGPACASPHTAQAGERTPSKNAGKN